MSWLLLAFFGGVASNISSYFSRVILKEKNSDSSMYAWFFEAVRFGVFAVVAVFDFHIVWTFYSLLLLTLLGVTEFISIYFYMKMYKYAHLSISTILFRTRLLWIPLLALVLLGEHLTIQTYIGIVVLFVGLAVVGSPHKLRFDKGQLFAYIAAFFGALNAVQLKMVQPLASPAVSLVFFTAPTVFLYPFLFKERTTRFTHFFSHNIGVKIVGALTSVLSIYFLALAVRSGPVSIATAVYQATMILSVLAGIFLLGEKEDSKRKIIGSLITIVGVMLLS